LHTISRTCNGPSSQCQSDENLKFTLTSVSLAPRVLLLENFLNEFEADQIISFSTNKVKESYVGNHDEGGGRTSDTRTSRNTWIPRQTSDLTETLSRRAADVLGLDEKLLWSAKNAEDLQVVSYVDGQRYDSHHDWGVSGRPESRFITMLMYLTTQKSPASGGETAFPKANNGLGMKVVPKKGNAVIFYNLLDDGNGDDLALHAALPCTDGKKWLANYWVWDPKRKD
jgi:prolyl 4-hydroxylase